MFERNEHRMKKNIIWGIIVLLLAVNVFQFSLNYLQFRGIAVPDEETAIVITQAILGDHIGPISTQSGVYDRTFDVTFNRFRRAWVVTVDFPEELVGVMLLGWATEVTISMRDARIIRIRSV